MTVRNHVPVLTQHFVTDLFHARYRKPAVPRRTRWKAKIITARERNWEKSILPILLLKRSCFSKTSRRVVRFGGVASKRYRRFLICSRDTVLKERSCMKVRRRTNPIQSNLVVRQDVSVFVSRFFCYISCVFRLNYATRYLCTFRVHFRSSVKS
jgi:hypothetical protein